MLLRPPRTPRLPCVTPQSSIRDAVAVIDDIAKGIALVVDGERRLLGTVTDGDVRRCMLAGLDLNTPVQQILDRKQSSPYPRPVTAPSGTAPETLLLMMVRNSIRQIPLVDAAGCVEDLLSVEDILPVSCAPPQAVIMAGGMGTRLRPLTDNLPKPMLPVNGKPLMEHIVTQLRDAGIHQMHVSTHYKPESIVKHFGDGSRFGVDISYVNEDRPLGTAGALSLMQPWSSTLLVINGDILTGTNFRAMQAFHQEHRATMTVGVRKYEVKVPYGVTVLEDVEIRGLQEKPMLRFFVNAGVYLIEPEAYPFVQTETRLDMTDLIERLLGASRRVVGFPISEYWIDIGQPSDYERAQKEFCEVAK